jgi:hypothetical protein
MYRGCARPGRIYGRGLRFYYAHNVSALRHGRRNEIINYITLKALTT